MLTVGISSYNQWEYLKRAIASALSETPSVFVYDDASQDDTIANLIREFPTVRCSWNKRNHGNFAPAWNHFITHVPDGWLLLLSGDDEVCPGAAARIEQYGKNADWLFGDLELIDSKSNPLALQTHEWMTTDPQEGIAQTIEMLSLRVTMFAAFRTEWLRANNLRAVEIPGTKDWCDTPTAVTWLSKNPRLKRCPYPLIRYRQHRDQQTHTSTTRPMMEEWLRGFYETDGGLGR